MKRTACARGAAGASGQAGGATAFMDRRMGGHTKAWTRGMPPPPPQSSHAGVESSAAVAFACTGSPFRWAEPRVAHAVRRPTKIRSGAFSSSRWRCIVTPDEGATTVASTSAKKNASANANKSVSGSGKYARESTVREYVTDPDVKMSPEDPGSVDMDANVRRVEGKADVRDARRNLIKEASTSTQAVHGGERIKGGKKARATLDAITTPIVQSSTFTFRCTREVIEYNEGLYESFEYGRYGNPTTRAAEEKLAMLEGTDDALISSSGMNAVTTMLLALVPAGGHIVTTTDCYRRTRQFVQTVLPKMGIRCTIIDPADVSELERILANDSATLFFSESPTNPMIRVVDVEKIVSLCRKYNVISCIDTTFATAYNFQPAEYGADLILHSGTKYLAGHNDVLCGALAGRADLIKEVRGLHGVLGGTLDPHSAFLLLRGMKTLSLRMEAHNRNAAAVAEFLSKHPKVSRVHYPTLPDHPDYEVAQRMFAGKGFGGVLSFELLGNGDPWSRETFELTGKFVDALRIPYIAPSLGGVETLIEQVCIMGYYDQPLHIRESLGINNGFIRFACGIESKDDILADLAQALDQI
ncbi:Cystathionine gamma-synthase 1, chloroplastic [Porphyridium purpureum]|uniref:Cystathionine gamma-synthase 1, chloroplastic n=1 Tax=Porphyridium purpureum TaxID=35688 RepID=A0A5J4Z6B6_PORPP|nr:Cystathionine gamma-synthase 1, chloroplastic [Porphyridium purpureum]|eukprot:POR1721..scf295_1